MTTEAKTCAHSLAPFRAEKDTCGNTNLYDAGVPRAKWIGCVHNNHSNALGPPNPGFPSSEEMEANTALFLAAPDLLEACEAALEDWDGDGLLTDICQGMLEAAIKKARGQ